MHARYNPKDIRSAMHKSTSDRARPAECCSNKKRLLQFCGCACLLHGGLVADRFNVCRLTFAKSRHLACVNCALIGGVSVRRLGRAVRVREVL